MEGEFRIILERAKSGDGEALEALLQDHLQGLRAFVRLKSGRLLRQKESHSDLVQSVCREALRDLGDVRCADEAGFRHWLYSLALNKVLHRAEYHAAQRRDPARVEDGADMGQLIRGYAGLHTPSQHVSAAEEIQRIETAIDQLSEEQREVLIQARLVGRSHEEIAADLGKSETAVRKILSRARARLGILLDLDPDRPD